MKKKKFSFNVLVDISIIALLFWHWQYPTPATTFVANNILPWFVCICFCVWFLYSLLLTLSLTNDTALEAFIDGNGERLLKETNQSYEYYDFLTDILIFTLLLFNHFVYLNLIFLVFVYQKLSAYRLANELRTKLEKKEN